MQRSQILFTSLLLASLLSSMAHSEDIKPKYKLVHVLIKNYTDATIEYKKEPLFGGMVSTTWDILGPKGSQDLRLYYLSGQSIFQALKLKEKDAEKILKAYHPSGNTPEVTVHILRDIKTRDLEVKFSKGI